MANARAKARKEIFSLTAEELNSKKLDLENELFNLRMQWRTGQLANTAAMAQARKNIARVKTALKQKAAEAKA